MKNYHKSYLTYPWHLINFASRVKNIIGMLLGLNRFYYPVNFVPFKGMDKFIRKMAIAPNNLSFRLKQTLQVEPHTAVNHLSELIEETFALVGNYMPEVDTTQA